MLQWCFPCWVTRGRFLTSASKFSVESAGGGDFDVSAKGPRVTQCENSGRFHVGAVNVKKVDIDVKTSLSTSILNMGPN